MLYKYNIMLEITNKMLSLTNIEKEAEK
jgi:hypothetical protein